MYPYFFQKPRKFGSSTLVTTAESESVTGADDAREQDGLPNLTGLNQDLSQRKLRYFPPKESLEELLERLMRRAEQVVGYSSLYLEKMLDLIKNNPKLVNHVPKKFHSNPLELALQLNDSKIAKELIALNAHVRPEYRHLQEMKLAPSRSTNRFNR